MESSSAPSWDALQAELSETFEESFLGAMDEYVEHHFLGTSSGGSQPQGLVILPLAVELTSTEKAIDILAPHLDHDPRYRP